MDIDASANKTALDYIESGIDTSAKIKGESVTYKKEKVLDKSTLEEEKEAAAAEKEVVEEKASNIINLKVIERSAGNDDKRKFTITFTPLQDIVMGGNAGPDMQGDQILITGLNNNGNNLSNSNWNLNEGEIWTDYNPTDATIGYTEDINKNPIEAGNIRYPQQGWRIWWKGERANSNRVYYIEIDRNTAAVAEKPSIGSITFQKNRELQIEFTIDAPWPVPGSTQPYNNYQNSTGNKIGVQIFSKNTDKRPTLVGEKVISLSKLVETTLDTYFQGRAPNTTSPYPTVGLPEEAADKKEEKETTEEAEDKKETTVKESEPKNQGLSLNLPKNESDFEKKIRQLKEAGKKFVEKMKNDLNEKSEKSDTSTKEQIDEANEKIKKLTADVNGIANNNIKIDKTTTSLETNLDKNIEKLNKQIKLSEQLVAKQKQLEESDKSLKNSVDSLKEITTLSNKLIDLMNVNFALDIKSDTKEVEDKPKEKKGEK